MSTRCCFCLFSYGNPATIIAEHHRNHLDRLWKKEHLFPHENAFQFSFKRLAWSLLAYPVGMAAYTLDVLLKAIRMVGNFFVLLGGVLCHDRYWAQNRAVVLLDSFVALLISALGILLPPVAYHLDSAAAKSLQKLLIYPPLHPFDEALASEVVENNVLAGDAVVVKKLQDTRVVQGGAADKV